MPRLRPELRRTRRTLRSMLACATAIALSAAVLAPTAALAETLRPAQFSHQADQHGFQWDVQHNGMINDGLNDCFDGGLRLVIDNQEFNPNQPAMMNEHGEFVLANNNMNGLQVSRRVRLMPEHGVMRYLEVITNDGRERTVDVTVRTLVGNMVQRVITSQGRNASGTLDRRSFGILCEARPGSRPSVAMLLTDTASRVRPVINVQQNRTIDATWKLPLKPNQTVVIYHAVAQRQTAAINDKAMADVFAPLYTKRLVDRTLSRDMVANLVNFSIAPGEGEPLLEMHQALLSERGIKSPAIEQVFLPGNGRLNGKVSVAGDALTIESHLGPLTLPLDSVAFVLGGAGMGRTHRVGLTNGEVIAGVITNPTLTLTSAEGFTLSFTPAQVDQYLRASVKPKVDDATAGFVDTAWGDRLAVAAAEGNVPMTTPWGGIEVTITELRQLSKAIDPPPGMRLFLDDGTRLAALPGTSTITATTLRFGRIELSPDEFIGFRRKASQTTIEPHIDWALDRGDPPALPHCRLIGGNRIVGQITLDTLTLQVSGSPMQLQAARIRSFERVEEEQVSSIGPQFNFTLTDGGTLRGHFVEATLPIQRSQMMWHLPVRQITGGRFAPAEKPDPSDEATPADEADAPEGDEAPEGDAADEAVDQPAPASDATGAAVQKAVTSARQRALQAELRATAAAAAAETAARQAKEKMEQAALQRNQQQQQQQP